MVEKADFLEIKSQIEKIDDSPIVKNMALERLKHAEILFDNETRRQQSPELYLKNLATQLKRALRYKQDEAGLDVRDLQAEYQTGKKALDSGDFQLAHERFLKVLDNFPWQDSAYEAYPWQKKDFVSFTDLPSWRARHGLADDEAVHLVEYDLEAIQQVTNGRLLNFGELTTTGKDAEYDGHQLLKPFRFNGESDRPIIFVIPGNRAHLACMEWQDPVYKDKLRCTEYSEHYTFRYMHALTDKILGLDKLPKAQSPIIVGLVFGGIGSRHENRLEHFATYEAGKAGKLWTHPRNKAPADALFYQIFAKRLGDKQVAKTPEESARATPYATITFSIGSSVSEQVINRGVKIARELGLNQSEIDSYFNRGLSTYVSGYQSDNVGSNTPMPRLIVTSILDENVICAPDPDNDVGALGFTSPFHSPVHAWQHLTKTDLLHIAMGRFDKVTASNNLTFSNNQSANVRFICGAMAIAFDQEGNLNPDGIMAANRFGHFIPPQAKNIENNGGLGIKEAMLSKVGILPNSKLFADRYKFPTTGPDQFVSIANQHIDNIYAQKKFVSESFFHAMAVFLSRINIEQKNGGPFGAVIVQYEGGIDINGKGIGKPQVIGIGANHVVPNNDPSAHAEMEAYRDAAKRRGYSDLAGAVLYTSCECCPMCLSVANGAGISKISYVNTREQAALIEFSDKQQYEMFSLELAERMTSLNQLDSTVRANVLEKLGFHDAVILDEKGEVFANGDADTKIDPTNIASINVIRKAVKKYAGIQAAAGNQEPIFSLPYGYTLVSRNIPHPAGWVTADWARLLRQPDLEQSNNPAFDSKVPDATRIIHVTDNYEQMPVIDKRGIIHIHQAASLTYQQPLLPNEKRAVKTEQFIRQVIPLAAQGVFNIWKESISLGAQSRY